MRYSVIKTKKQLVNLKQELLKNKWIDEIICLRSKDHSLRCNGDNESKNKLEGISKS